MKTLTVSLAIAMVSLSMPAARQAKACSFPCPTKVKPPSLGNVPSNALVIPVEDPSIALSLIGPGGPVALVLDKSGKAWVPRDGDLAEGAYKLSYQEICRSQEPPVQHQSEFYVNLGPSEYPTLLGTPGISEAGVTVGGDQVFARVYLDSDAIFGRFSGLSRVSVTVDGQPASSFNLTDDNHMYGVRAYCGQEPRNQPERDSCGGVTTVAPGVHRVTFSGSVTGSPNTLKDVSIDVRVDCAWRQSIQPQVAPALGPTAPATQPTMDMERAGCSVAGAGTLPAAASLTWLGLGLVLTVVRARRRRS